MDKPIVAGVKPIVTALKAGEIYAYCTCGRSQNQPFCDGSHQGTTFSSMKFYVDDDTKKPLCTCKQTQNPPYCDGSHRGMKEEEIGTQKLL